MMSQCDSMVSSYPRRAALYPNRHGGYCWVAAVCSEVFKVRGHILGQDNDKGRPARWGIPV